MASDMEAVRELVRAVRAPRGDIVSAAIDALPALEALLAGAALADEQLRAVLAVIEGEIERQRGGGGAVLIVPDSEVRHAAE
jgi:hypothetical protein